MTTEEGNKLIAEFMGWTSSKSSDAGILGGSITYWKNPDTGHVGYFHPDKYHTSWDWLMPVVENIENIRNEKGTYLYCVDIGRDCCDVVYNDVGFRIITRASFNNNKIKSTHEAIVKFIEWYNQNPQ